MGHNIFECEAPIAMIQAVRAVVHGQEKPDKAYELSLTLKKDKKTFDKHCAMPYITHFFNELRSGLVEKFEVKLYQDFAVGRCTQLPRLENGAIAC